jgi:hypothetical protein
MKATLHRVLLALPRHCQLNAKDLYWVIVTVRQQSAHSFSALHSMQGAGKGNLRSHYESTYGRCARRIRGSASSVQCCRTVIVTLYILTQFAYESARFEIAV